MHTNSLLTAPIAMQDAMSGLPRHAMPAVSAPPPRFPAGARTVLLTTTIASAGMR